jgi:hypothetical protein
MWWVSNLVSEARSIDVTNIMTWDKKIEALKAAIAPECRAVKMAT